MNHTPDISEFVTYKWFQWCWFYDEASKVKTLCRWIGPVHHIGQVFCSYLLLQNGHFISRSLVIPISNDELETPHMRDQCSKFMTVVNDKIGNAKEPIYDPDNPDIIYYDGFFDNAQTDDNEYPYEKEILDEIPDEIDEPYLDSLDHYIGTKVVIPGNKPGVEPVLATIKRQKRDSEPEG